MRCSSLLLLVCAILAATCYLPLASASATRKMDDMHAKLTAQKAAGTVRYQRFNSDRTPLETLFDMKTERREDLQAHVADMMKQTRLHTEARRKVQEEMDRMRHAAAGDNDGSGL